jgi:site-specific DNA-methyltransferase (adenine-specific)
VSLRKITQDTTASSYAWVPQQSWDRAWTDEVLYAKYGLTSEEVGFIESQVKEMDAGDD